MESLLDIRVGEAIFGSIDVSAPWAFRVSPGSYATLYVVLAGSAILEFDDGSKIDIAAGGVVSILNGREHVLCDRPDSLQHTDAITLSFETLNDIDMQPKRFPGADKIVAARVPIASNPLPDVLAGAIYVPPTERALCKRLYSVLHMAGGLRDAPEKIRDPIAKRIAEILAIELTEFSLNSAGSAWSARISDPRIRRTIELIRVHPERHWTVERLADEACMSRSAFAARFREVVGLTPVSYLHTLRMERARDLVRSTALPLYEIATRVGYASDTAFNKAFHRKFGSSPARYRKSEKS